MKSVIASAIALILVLSLAACGSNTAPTEGSQPTTDAATQAAPANTSKILVAYFSATGTTKGIAERIASTENADLFEIVPAEPYSDDDLNWKDDNSRATKEQNDSSVRPAISSEIVSFNGYDTIYLGYPIWWYIAPTIINTFLEAYDFSGKKIVLFATSGGSGFGKAAESLQPSAPDAQIIAGEILNGNPNEKKLQAFAEKY